MLLDVTICRHIKFDLFADYVKDSFPYCGKDKFLSSNTEARTVTLDINNLTKRQHMWLDLCKAVEQVEDWKTTDGDTEATLTLQEASFALAAHIGHLQVQEIGTSRLEQVQHVLHQLTRQTKQAYRHALHPGSRPAHYHKDCVEHNPPEGVTFELIPLSDVPAGTECDFCYEPMYGPSGYEIRGTFEAIVVAYDANDDNAFSEKTAMKVFDLLSQQARDLTPITTPGYRIVDVRIEGDRESGRVYARFEKQA